MLYLENISAGQYAVIPSDGVAGQRSVTFALVSTIEHRTIMEQDATLDDDIDGYITIVVQLPEGTANGEYEYRLYDGGSIVLSGVARIGARPQAHMEGSGGIEFRSGN